MEDTADDLLWDHGEIHWFEGKRIDNPNTHGTGCTISSAIAANLANGLTVEEAVKSAKEYITTAIEHSFAIGQGVGPTNHFYTLYKKAGLNYE